MRKVLIILALLIAGCWSPSVPPLPKFKPIGPVTVVTELPKLHAEGVGSIPAVSVSLSTLTWLIRGLFIAAAGATVAAALTSAIPFLGAIGWRTFGRVAAACAGTAIACMALAYTIARIALFVDRHPVLTALGFIGTSLAIAGLWGWGHRVVFEKFFHIDIDGDGTIGEKK